LKLWQSVVTPEELHQQELVLKVSELFDRLLLRTDVIDNLRNDQSLDAPSRAFAIQVAQTQRENLGKLCYDAWLNVQPQEYHLNYGLALRWAEVAVKARPSYPLYTEGLAAAQYRVGRFADALANFAKAEKLREQKDPGPGALAFRAMAYERLGY